jgi:hypothetical protein
MGRNRLGGVATMLAPEQASLRQLALGITAQPVAVACEVLVPGAV